MSDIILCHSGISPVCLVFPVVSPYIPLSARTMPAN
nr:MAG TPA: hypothetical protein [Bacteriophage sp.]